MHYKTRFTDSSFYLSGNNVSGDRLFKPAWIGWPADAILDNTRYRIERTGFWNNKFHLKHNNQVLLSARIRPLTAFFPEAVATNQKGGQFIWTQKGFFSRSWQWSEDSRVIIKSSEKNKMFRISGEIVFLEKRAHSEDEYELLSILGLHLRNVAGPGKMIRIMLLLVYLFILFILKPFS